MEEAWQLAKDPNAKTYTSIEDALAELKKWVTRGYNDAVAETARLTETRPELDEQEQWAINERLAYIADHIHEQPEVKIQYFVPDDRKSGGSVVSISGKVKKISATDGTIVMADGNAILISDIIAICQ